MKRTVITHFYNEEFLLPVWLMHHSVLFDKMIMIDYASTDKSVEIIKEHRDMLGLDIDIIQSRNNDFGAHNVDAEVQDIENNIDGWKCCLNVTEHLYGDFSKCDEQPVQHIVPSIMMTDTKWRDTAPLRGIFNWAHGVPYWVWNERAGRSFHNFNVDYPKPGRHYFVPNEAYSKDFMILHYGWYPMCTETINRKLQIQTRIPEYDVNNRLGWHHITTRENLLEKWRNEYIPKVIDCSDIIKPLIEKTYKCASLV